MRKTLINLGIIAAIFFSCAFFQLALMSRADKLERHEVTTISSNFPIVVVTEDKAQIVYGEELEKFKRQHSDYSFLVPVDKYELFQEQIKSNTRAQLNLDRSRSELPWDANFRMEAIASDRQKFVVYATWDDDRENTGEYEATDKELFPKYHKVYFGPGKVFVTFPIALLFTAGLWSVLGAVVWYWRQKRRVK
jgi:hypothetical protein